MAPRPLPCSPVEVKLGGGKFVWESLLTPRMWSSGVPVWCEKNFLLNSFLNLGNHGPKLQSPLLSWKVAKIKGKICPAWVPTSLDFLLSLRFCHPCLLLFYHFVSSSGPLRVCVLKSPIFSSVQSLSHVRLFATPWTTARQPSVSITNPWSPLKPMSIELVMPSNHLILCRSFLLLPSIFPSIRVLSNDSALHQVAKVLEFQLQHQSLQWTPRTDLL